MQQALSLLVTCKPSGRLVRIVEDSGALLQHDPLGSLLTAVDSADLDAFKQFMHTLQQRGRAFNGQLRVRGQQGNIPMHVAGVAGDALLWVAAAPDPGTVLALLSQAECEIKRPGSRPQLRCSTFVLDQLTSVNNELVNLQRELAQRNAALVALTVERNQLLGIAAHDLRNPIMVVQSYCELLLSSKGGALDPQKAQFVTRVHEASDAMLQLLQDTLDYSRLASADLKLNLAPTDLSVLLEKNVLDYQPLAERKHITLSLHSPNLPLPTLWLDAAKIERVLVNLLSNAIKYSHEGAAIEVYLSCSNDFARVSVRDHGEGIAPKEIPLLFRPFQIGSNRPTAGEPSTGLGLAIVKKLVEAHGGHVTVSSERHGGSSFNFELPLEPPAHSHQAPAQSAHETEGGHANDARQDG